MNWVPSPEAVNEAFARVIPDDPVVQKRKMFGYPAAFAGGNMFAGVWQTSVVLRLPSEERAEFLALEGATPFEPMGRSMREYVVAPERMLADPSSLRPWVEQAMSYALTLPAKEPRRRQPKGKK